MHTDAPNKKCFFLVKPCAAVEGMLIVPVTRRIWSKRAIIWGKIIVPENNTF